MDSLLGIGIAGGGTSKGEGKALASRLSEMRKESNERAKAKVVTKKKEQASSPMMGMGGSGPAGQMTLQYFSKCVMKLSLKLNLTIAHLS